MGGGEEGVAAVMFSCGTAAAAVQAGPQCRAGARPGPKPCAAACPTASARLLAAGAQARAHLAAASAAEVSATPHRGTVSRLQQTERSGDGRARGGMGRRGWLARAAGARAPCSRRAQRAYQAPLHHASAPAPPPAGCPALSRPAAPNHSRRRCGRPSAGRWRGPWPQPGRPPPPGAAPALPEAPEPPGAPPSRSAAPAAAPGAPPPARVRRWGGVGWGGA